MTKAIWIGIAEVVIACAAVFGLWSASTTGAFAQSVHSPATPTQCQQAPAQSELLTSNGKDAFELLDLRPKK
jgi:hypothetical protein